MIDNMKLQYINGQYRTYTPMNFGFITSYIPREWSRLEDAIAYISLMK